MGFGGFILWLTLLGGRLGRANREGSMYFLAFFHNRSAWAKTGAALGEEGVFANGFGFEIGHGRGKKTKAFSILSRETL